MFSQQIFFSTQILVPTSTYIIQLNMYIPIYNIYSNWPARRCSCQNLFLRDS